MNPSLVIADEPVSSLDVSVRAQILNLMRDLQDESGMAYIFIAHDLSAVRHMSARIAVMYLGRIVETGDSEALFRAPIHPYTRALIDSSPGRGRAGDRRVLTGDVPSPLSPPPGCAFHPRCPAATDRCRLEMPLLRDFGGGRSAACHEAERTAA